MPSRYIRLQEGRSSRGASSAQGSVGRRSIAEIQQTLVNNHKRSMGTADSPGWDQSGPDRHPPVQRTLRFSPQPDRPASPAASMSGDSPVLSSQGHYRASARQQSRPVCGILRGSKERFTGAKRVLGRSSPERVHKVRTLQDGRCSDSEGLDSARRLHDKGGHIRCISTSTGSDTSSASIPIHMAGNGVSVSQLMLRSLIGSSNIHQGDEASHRVDPKHGHQVCHLSRRHSVAGIIRRGSSEEHTVLPESIGMGTM